MTPRPFDDPVALVRRVYAYVAYRIGDGPDAEDVTSAAFERALRYRSSFDPSRGDASSWLIGIARRCIADAAVGQESALGDSIERTVDGHADAVVERLDLAAAISVLSSHDRELVALRYGADLTARQIGEVLDMRTNAVEVALHRALDRLRSQLTPKPEESRPGSELDPRLAPE